MERLRSMGINTVTILLNGRMRSIDDSEIRPPSKEEIERARSALIDANALGIATVLTPLIYLDDGQWRGNIQFRDPAHRDAWWESYNAFIEGAARVASSSGTSLFCIGVELKSLSDEDDTAKRMRSLARRVKRDFKGPLTYGANWDEAEQVTFWDTVDIASVNAYYPLLPEPFRGAEAVGRRLTALSRLANRPVLALEVGFRSSPLSHMKPWEWPNDVEPIEDEDSQANAWAAVLTHWLDAEGVRGLMIWVIPTDPDDPASEPSHGFNPLNKMAEHVIRRAFERTVVVENTAGKRGS